MAASIRYHPSPPPPPSSRSIPSSKRLSDPSHPPNLAPTMPLVALMVLKASDSSSQSISSSHQALGPSPPVELLASALDLSNISWIYAGSVRQLLVFACRTLAARTSPGSRQSVCQQDYWLRAYHEPSSNLIGVAATDSTYPESAAFRVLDKVIRAFLQDFPNSATVVAQHGVNIPANWPFLTQALARFKDPAQADPLLKVQQDLEESRHVIHQTIHGLLERGEKLDSLVEKSEDLSMASRAFYMTAKNQNNCCSLG